MSKNKERGLTTMSAKLPIPLKENVFRICEENGVKFPWVMEMLMKSFVAYAAQHPKGEMPLPLAVTSKSSAVTALQPQAGSPEPIYEIASPTSLRVTDRPEPSPEDRNQAELFALIHRKGKYPYTTLTQFLSTALNVDGGHVMRLLIEQGYQFVPA